MKRVEKVDVVRRLGRPPKAWEHYSGPGSPCIYIRGPGAPDSSFVMPYCEAVEITPEDREYEVEDPAPEWIVAAVESGQGCPCDGWVPPGDYGGNWATCKLLHAAYRAEVAKRAKEAAEKLMSAVSDQRARDNVADIIFEAVLSGEP